MRGLSTLALAAAIVALPGSVSADTPLMHGFVVQLYSTSDAAGSGSEPREVARGGMFMIVGACVADSDDDVRVVLSLADKPDGRPGYRNMLLTDQSREANSLRVRVPDMPDMSHHVYRVRLYVGADEPRVCEAGSIRIV